MTIERAGRLRLTVARACAWALLVAGWVGIGSLALKFAPSVGGAFALTSLWLLALGAAATVATRGGMRRSTRGWALCIGAGITGFGLVSTVNGSGLPALLLALVGWAALTALASGVVRGLRLAQSSAPAPPIAAATLGALCAGLVLADPGDLPALATRLAALVGAIAVLLVLLQRWIPESPRKPGCRAGLFDCSLPAWPAGAWRETRQWPVLISGLAMLPMMAALPLMAAWCSAQSVASQTTVMLHLAAMFVPALALERSIARWSPSTLSNVCAALLAMGAAVAVWAAAPFDLVGVTITYGAAWGLAWSGQLWAPARRGEQRSSPLIAAVGYAVLTLAFGLLVEHLGARGVIVAYAALGLGAVVVWTFRSVATVVSWVASSAAKVPGAPRHARHGGDR